MEISPRARAAIAVLVGLFFLLAALGGDPASLDGRILRWLADARAGHDGLLALARCLSQMGSIWMTLVLPLAISLMLFLIRQRRTAVALAGFALVERALQEGVKLLIDRPRPPVADWAVDVHSLSFPSGHSMNSLAMWTAMALLLSPPAARRVLAAVAVVLAVAISLSRPLLGVHYPSDVLGGWALAAILLLLANGAGLFERRLS